MRFVPWVDRLPVPAPVFASGRVCCPRCGWRRRASRRVLARYRRHYLRRHGRR